MPRSTPCTSSSSRRRREKAPRAPSARVPLSLRGSRRRPDGGPLGACASRIHHQLPPGRVRDESLASRARRDDRAGGASSSGTGPRLEPQRVSGWLHGPDSRESPRSRRSPHCGSGALGPPRASCSVRGDGLGRRWTARCAGSSHRADGLGHLSGVRDEGQGRYGRQTDPPGSQLGRGSGLGYKPVVERWIRGRVFGFPRRSHGS